MRRFLIAVPLLLLSGCSTPELLPNELACQEFETLTLEIAERAVENTWVEADTGYFADRLDQILDTSEGEVLLGVERLRSSLPEPISVLPDEPANYFDDVRAVVNACAAAGVVINPTIWQDL